LIFNHFLKVGCNATGFYELAAVLTHIGRSSDSGHYMAWVRKEECMIFSCSCSQNFFKKIIIN